MMRFLAAILRFIAARVRLVALPFVITALILCSCESKKKTDSSKVPIDVKEAEARDSTRMDSARTDVVPDWGRAKADSSSADSL